MGQCALTMCTPFYCACGLGTSCCWECGARRSPYITNCWPGCKPMRTHLVQFIVGAVLLAIGIPIFVYISVDCGGVNFQGGGDCWSEGSGKHFGLGAFGAITLGFGFPLAGWGIVAVCIAAIKGGDSSFDQKTIDEQVAPQGTEMAADERVPALDEKEI